MTDTPTWLGRRRPTPPEPLARWLDGVLSVDSLRYGELLRPALEALDRARQNPGRIRGSAFDLLGADALLTYACEAALESPDPGSALEEILRETAADRP